ncbi:MAG: hypothetical protein EAZ27_09575 [Cytophagales bacterium]|nr:MAG: hypothetical protein EAZ27_09575 [Cytophagales bacterium]
MSTKDTIPPHTIERGLVTLKNLRKPTLCVFFNPRKVLFYKICILCELQQIINQRLPRFATIGNVSAAKLRLSKFLKL